ncbi:MAG TPA: hypothetical protein VG843_08730 [Rhizomicrobium sp.]|nr:hypothetical protein [Rhizomicrobium sp.]
MAAAAAAAVMALPALLAQAPAMPDYPAHLASYHLIETGAKAASVSKFYHIHWALIPNLGGEIIVPALAKLLGLELAARLFVAAAIAMWVLGPAFVRRALFGRAGAEALFAAFFAYNANLTWGFLNYDFAAGAAFLFLAAWIASEERRAPAPLMLFALAATAIYFCHLFAAAMLLLLVGCYELDGLLRKPSFDAALRRLGAIFSVFLPSIVLFFFKPQGADRSFTFNLWDRALDRIDAAIQMTYDNPSYVLLATLAIFLVAGLWRGWVRLNPRMLLPLGVLALGAIFAPEWAMGGWGIDLRLPAAVGALAFASSEFRLDRRLLAAFAASAGLVLAANAVILAKDWMRTDLQFAEFRSAARSLPPGLRLLTVLDGDAIGYRSDQPYWHMAEFAIIDPGAFTPLLFTTADQHVVRLSGAYQPIAAASAEQGSPPDIDELEDLAASQIDEDEDIANVFPYLMKFQCHFDVAVVVHLGGPRSAIPPVLKLRHAGSFFSLYDIQPDSRCRR